MTVRRVGILIFDEVEVLDFAGPFEVFAVAGELHGGAHFATALVAREERVHVAVNGLRVLPNETFASGRRYDVLVIPGGVGTRALLRDPETLAWVRAQAAGAEVVMSVCSGARVMAAAGLLHGRRATTHHEVLDDVAALEPTATLLRDVRYVDEGPVVTCGGISAGIDGSLHLVRRLAGEAAAARTARYMEYGPGERG